MWYCVKNGPKWYSPNPMYGVSKVYIMYYCIEGYPAYIGVFTPCGHTNVFYHGTEVIAKIFGNPAKFLRAELI